MALAPSDWNPKPQAHRVRGMQERQGKTLNKAIANINKPHINTGQHLPIWLYDHQSSRPVEGEEALLSFYSTFNPQCHLNVNH